MAGVSTEHKLEPADAGKGDDEKKRNRRGRGSRSKQAEHFRMKKNRESDVEIKAKIEDFKVSLGYSPAELFGNRSLTSIIYTHLEAPVNTDVFGYLCVHVSDVLHGACKIQGTHVDPMFFDDPSAYDCETLMWVTALQVEAKMYHARAGTPFLPDSDADVFTRVSRTSIMFPDALVPLAVVLDQLGRFTCSDQVFVPAFNGRRDFSYGRVLVNECIAHFPGFRPENIGLFTGQMAPNGRYVVARVLHADAALAAGIINEDGALTDEFRANPGNFNWFGALEFGTGYPHRPPPTFEQIASRYADLRGRVNKKLTNVFVDLSLTRGVGTESQIVYSAQVPETEKFEAWSPRRVRSDALEMGAILQLGWMNALGSRSASNVEIVVDTSAGLQCLANVLTKRVR